MKGPLSVVGGVAVLLIAATVDAQGRGQAPAPPRASAPAPNVQAAPADIPDVVISEIAAVVSHSSTTFAHTGVSRVRGQTAFLTVTTNRALIAFQTQQALNVGGRFTPPPALKADVVMATCGDGNLIGRWDCAGLTVSVGGRAVEPVSYSAEPQVFRNALGASWSARIVRATYRVDDLRSGFTVTGRGTDGIEFDEYISKDAADRQLLFAMPSELTLRDAVMRAIGGQ